MKSQSSRLSLPVILICAAVEGFAQQQVDCTGRPEVCAFFERFLTAFNGREWNQFRDCLDDDITVMFDSPASPERKTGRVAVEKMFRPLFPDSGVALRENRYMIKPQEIHIQDFGEAVVISFHLRETGVLARRSLIVRRHDNRWKIVHIHASSFELAPK